jgi:hypothetical protein
MRGTQPRLRHLVGAATLSGSLLLGALTFASLPAGAQTAAIQTAVTCPVLSVGNPNPGDQLSQGDYVVSGAAWDPSAPAGSGIARVDLFLGPRDEGGTFLGSTVPGLGANPRAFSVTVTLPNVNEGNTFAAYAISGVTGQQTSVLIPVFVGTPTRSQVGPTPTPIPTTETVTTTCPTGAAAATPVAAGMPMVSPAAPSAPAPSNMAAPPAAAAAAASTGATGSGAVCPVLTLGNPNPGDVMSAGDLVISGGAYEPGASSGSGVSSVDLFLGPRDQGGTFLGSAAPGSGQAGPNSWSVLVTVPDWGRGSSFNAYAIGANGQQYSIGFPVFVGTVPPRSGVGATPTPIPQTVTTASTCH